MGYRTQAEVAAEVGIPQQTLSRWEEGSNTHSANVGNASHNEINQTPDLRLSIPRTAYKVIYERVEHGETQARGGVQVVDNGCESDGVRDTQPRFVEV